MAAGHFAEHFQLGLAFHVEAADAGFQRLAHLGAGLAHAREDHLRPGRRRRPAHALQLAARHDVKAAAWRANTCSTASDELAFMA
jgi:hypothetical protein